MVSLGACCQRLKVVLWVTSLSFPVIYKGRARERDVSS
jgi:hypothetical protein